MASAAATALNEENPIETPDQHQQQQQSDPATTNAAPSDDVNSSPKDESKSVGDSPAVGSEAVKNEDGDAPVTDIQKKIRRAERFGTSVQLSEEEKRNSRAERFGTGSGSGSGSGSAINGSEALKKSEEQKRKARAERFGSLQSAPSDEEAKKKARHARFAGVPKTDPLEEDKKKARAIRFSQPPSGAISQVNGKVNDIDIKGAIKGKVGGET